MKYAHVEWKQGHPYSPDYEDIYYSGDGKAESEHVFLQGNNLFERWKSVQTFTIAETGFGSGLNFVLTANAWLQHADEHAVLQYVAIEKHPLSPDDIERVSDTLSLHWPELNTGFDELLDVYPLPVEGSHLRTLYAGRIRLQLIFGDVLEVLQQYRLRVDAWYLDGFTPATNPAMWSEQLCALIAGNSRAGATLSTYTCAGSVRRALQTAGFDVAKIQGHGKKREMISAVLAKVPEYKSKQPWYEWPPTPKNEKSALIVGAGLAGLSVAWALSQHKWRVTLVDEHRAIASGASGNPAAMLVPRLSVDDTPDAAFYLEGFLHSIVQLDGLQNLSNKSSEPNQPFWFKTGVHMPVEASRAEKLFSDQRYPENLLQLLTTADVEFLNANANDVVACIPEAGWVASSTLCKALAQACGDRLDIITMKVHDIKRIDNAWSIMDENNVPVLSSPVVILANASAVKDFSVTSWLPLQSVRGQITAVDATGDSGEMKRALSSAARSSGVFATPERNGVHYTGATYDLTETSIELLQSDQRKNWQQLNALIPDMFTCPQQLTGRVGFRAVSEDRMPIVGPVPDKTAYVSQYQDFQHGKPVEKYQSGEYLPGLYVSAAHGSRGLSSCFLSAEIIAALLSDSLRPVSDEIACSLHPARFLIRKLKRALPIP